MHRKEFRTCGLVILEGSRFFFYISRQKGENRVEKALKNLQYLYCNNIPSKEFGTCGLVLEGKEVVGRVELDLYFSCLEAYFWRMYKSLCLCVGTYMLY